LRFYSDMRNRLDSTTYNRQRGVFLIHNISRLSGKAAMSSAATGF
jgi:hypothetical protein